MLACHGATTPQLLVPAEVVGFALVVAAVVVALAVVVAWAVVVDGLAVVATVVGAAGAPFVRADYTAWSYLPVA